ncbi:MAG: hypothetical protein PWR17_501 [Candidatus Methanomethylophilaceae archaeon]|nr:hypothetical protein [Candidatus Methanomethylophilaceae archaeon]
MPGCYSCSPTSEKMSAFVRGPDGAAITGRRRTGRGSLMEDIADIAECTYPESKVVRVRGVPPEGLSAFLEREMAGGDCVMIYSVTDHPDWERAVRSVAKGPTRVYCGQDLCHQVPACFKRIIR